MTPERRCETSLPWELDPNETDVTILFYFEPGYHAPGPFVCDAIVEDIRIEGGKGQEAYSVPEDTPLWAELAERCFDDVYADDDHDDE